jgi:glycosyltransferase involved in cell wall biosynthesis
MRAGLPVVATPVGGIPEAVRDGVNGLLATTAGLAATLTKLIDNPELRAQLGAEARRTYESRFRFDRMAEETADIYRSLLSKSP